MVSPYAFVCFESQQSTSDAIQALNGVTFEGRNLIVNHYEIKEIRLLQIEEMKDQNDWDKYISQNQNTGLGGLDLDNQAGISSLIESILQTISFKQHQEQ